MLSNTVTPKYYGAFRDSVLRGEIPVCRNIEMEMNRIDELIRNPDYYYDEQAVEGFIYFCETEMCLSDGRPLKLLPSFKLWAEQCYGWYEYVDKDIWIQTDDNGDGYFETKKVLRRLTHSQYLIIPRGNAKSMYETCHQYYNLLMVNNSNKQIHTAPTMAQADEVMQPIRVAITQSRGPITKFLTQGSIQNTTGDPALRPKLMSTKAGIRNDVYPTILEVRPMSVDKLEGLRCKIATVDEWLSGYIREMVTDSLEQSCAKGDQEYLILAVSSEGTVRNGPGDTVKMWLMEMLKGEVYDPHVSIWWYMLDDLKEIDDPSTWRKANPNLGHTITYETLRLEVAKAEANPSYRNDMVAKRFDIPMEGYTYFFTYDETLPMGRQSFHGMPCSMGADLSQGDDFCAFTLLFPLGGDDFGVKTRAYISERTLQNLPPAQAVKYQEFMDEDTLQIMPGTVLDMMEVYDDLENWLDENQYDPYCFGYDPYNAKDFVDRWIREHGSFGVVKVIQGAKTESVPLGEIKKLAADRLLIFDEKLMQFAMGNCIVLEDNNGNRKLYKRRYDQKIDNVAALMDGWIAFKLNKESFY